jgi:hypothetical protein
LVFSGPLFPPDPGDRFGVFVGLGVVGLVVGGTAGSVPGAGAVGLGSGGEPGAVGG